jgi:uncharacterized protein YukE
LGQAIANADELDAFANELRHATLVLEQTMSRLNGRFVRLGETWRDQQHQRFAQEFEQTLRVISRFSESAERQIPFLHKKASQIRLYLGQ